MPLDPSVNQKLQDLVADLEAKEQALSDTSDVNDQAQSTAQAAVAAAAGTLQAKSKAHSDMSDSIDALVTFVTGLK